MNMFLQLSPPSRDLAPSTNRNLRAIVMAIVISTAITASSNRRKGGEVWLLGLLIFLIRTSRIELLRARLNGFFKGVHAFLNRFFGRFDYSFLSV